MRDVDRSRPAILAIAVSAGAAVAAALVLTGCSGTDRPAAEPASPLAPVSSSASPSAVSAGPPTATPAPTPAAGACYALTYAQAVAPTTERRPVACSRRHTTTTYAVGRLDTVVDGHLLAVDSERVQAEVAKTCPDRFAGFVGGTADDRRLSMLRPVWFTPTVQESDAGAEWFRCDVVAVAGDERLARLSGSQRGVLDAGDGRDRYGMCGTAEPGTASFERVVCSAPHSWRAVRVVPFADGPYPGTAAVRSAGDGPCQDEGAAAAGGALDYEWGYEGPSADQWASGQHFGRCWVPD